MIAATRLPRRGFTLLELLLTLSLAVVLIGLVGGALRFYAVDMNVREMDLEQTRVAAAVMQMIEDDLRATMHTQPVDTAPLEELLSSLGGGSDSGGGADAGTGDADLSAAGVESEATTEEETELASSSSADLQSGSAVLQAPGLIGNQYQIQIDISRLPRLEEYVQMLDENAGNLEDIPSDLKSVSYYVQDAGGVGGIADPLDALGADVGEATLSGGGLVRRSLDRAATSFAATSSAGSTLNMTGELLAPEVVGIEFSYWDGTTWLQEWSSDQYGELPLAVQVRLSMPDPTASSSLTSVDMPTRTFVHVVRLPLARPIVEEDLTAETEP